MNQKKRVIVVCIVLILTVAGVLRWQKKEHQILLQDQQLSDNQVQPDTNIDTPVKFDEASFPQHIVAIPGSDSVWYEIPELGVRMQLNKEFAEDLIYHPVHFNNTLGEWDAVYFATKTDVRFEPFCSPEAGSFVVLSKRKGVAKEILKKSPWYSTRYAESLANTVQIGNFFYLYEKSLESCYINRVDEYMKFISGIVYEGKGIKSLTGGKNLYLIPEEKIER